MNILVLGAGMYVTGRNDTGVGTVLSSLAQISKQFSVSHVVVVARSSSNQTIVAKTTKRINQKLQSNLKVSYISLNNNLTSICAENKIDCAIVATPDHLHFPQIKELLHLNIHVLSVKPLVNTVKENLELANIQKKRKLIGMVEFHKRYDEANLLTKKLIQEGKLGNLLYYDVDYSQRIDIPVSVFKNWAHKSNIFQYLGIHYVDLFHFLTGAIPKKVVACGTDGILKEKGINTHDSIHATIIWEDRQDNKKIISCFNTNWIDPSCTSALSDQKYKLVGTAGRIENDHKNRGIEVVSESEKIQHPNPYFSEYLLNCDGNLEFQGYGFKSIQQFISDTYDVMNNKRSVESFEKVRPTFSQAIVSTAVVEGVNSSIKQNFKWININDSF